MRLAAWGCLGMIVLGVIVFCAGLFLLSKVPRSYPAASKPISISPEETKRLGDGLDGFESPYLGHTGSWDGKGGGMFGRSKIPDLEKECRMGLRWTFMPVYWRALEPAGPVDLRQGTPPEWKALDDFVIAAKKRRLNVLMQAPVMGGNAGGPPEWAGRRSRGQSAPDNMAAAAEFAGKLAARYCPGGTLSAQQGWGRDYGVRAWELDNEPESYRASWRHQALDYAEFAVLCAEQIKKVDPEAVIVTPGMAGGSRGIPWLEQALIGTPRTSPGGTETARFSIGRVTDVVSFHCYEGLETAFSSEDRTIGRDFSEVQAAFEKWEQSSSASERGAKRFYWHTEGNFDFLGILSPERRAAWRFQFFTRAFAAGVAKVCVMDACPAEQEAIRAYVEALPSPFPMVPATDEVAVVSGRAVAYVHSNAADAPGGRSERVWVIWPVAGSGEAVVEVPVASQEVICVTVDGKKHGVTAANGKIRLTLAGDKKMAPGVILIDGGSGREGIGAGNGGAGSEDGD